MKQEKCHEKEIEENYNNIQLYESYNSHDSRLGLDKAQRFELDLVNWVLYNVIIQTVPKYHP